MQSLEAIESTKPGLRRVALARRDAIAPDARLAAANALAGRPFPVELRPGLVVSGFMPIRSEIDPGPLMRSLAARGARLALPVLGEGRALGFRAYTPGDLLIRNAGIDEPLPSAPITVPDILLVPLAGFDRGGHRIGYGAGYYDVTLERLRAERSVIAVGLAFAIQEVASVPFETHDAKLDFIMTEREVVDCRGT